MSVSTFALGRHAYPRLAVRRRDAGAFESGALRGGDTRGEHIAAVGGRRWYTLRPGIAADDEGFELSFKFLSHEEWSVHGLICCMIPIALLGACAQPFDLGTMTVASVLGMMRGRIAPRMAFTAFLCVMLIEPTTGWLMRSALFMLSSAMIYRVPYRGPLHLAVLRSRGLMWLFRVMLGLWAAVGFYLIGDVLLELLRAG